MMGAEIPNLRPRGQARQPRSSGAEKVKITTTSVSSQLDPRATGDRAEQQKHGDDYVRTAAVFLVPDPGVLGSRSRPWFLPTVSTVPFARVTMSRPVSMHAPNATQCTRCGTTPTQR